MSEYNETGSGGIEVLGFVPPCGGILTTPLATLHTMILNCPSTSVVGWNVYVNAATSGSTGEFARPSIIICFADGMMDTTIETRSYNRGDFDLLIEATVDAADRTNHNAATYAFIGKVEQFVEDLWDQVGGENSLLINAIRMTTAPQRAAHTQGEDYFQCVVNVSWGVS